MSGPLRDVTGEPDQVPRLLAFKEAHPEVELSLNGLWRASIPPGAIPGEDKAVYLNAYHLRVLLDKLDAAFADPETPGLALPPPRGTRPGSLSAEDEGPG